MSFSRIHAPAVATMLIAAFGFLASPAAAQLVSYDGFGNGPLSNLAGSTGGTGWSSAWSNVSTDVTKVSGPGLSYPGLARTPGAAVTPLVSDVWPSSIYQRSFSLPAGTTKLYLSFLMRDDTGGGIWGGLSFGQYPGKLMIGSPMGYYTYGLQWGEYNVHLSNKPLVQGQTTLVVLRITQNAVANATSYDMFLDPQIGSPEPSIPNASLGLGGIFPLPGYFAIDNGTGFTTDEIRVGTTWSSVLPAEPNAWTDVGFAKPGISGAPHFVGTGPLTANSTNTVTLTNAKPQTTAMLILGASAWNAPFMGGYLVPAPTILLPMTTNASGSVTLQSTWPAGVPAGTPIFLQYWIEDPAATLGLAASNGLLGTSH